LDLDHALIQIRERSFLDLLDLAMVVVRNRPGQIALAALVGVAPFAALNAWLMTLPEFTLVHFAVLLAIEVPWATAPLTVVLGLLMFGERPEASHVARALMRGVPALILYQLIIRAVLVTTAVGYLFVPARLAFQNEVILLEKGRIDRVPRRCAALSSDRGGEFLVQWICQMLLGLMFTVCFWFGTSGLASALTTSQLTWDRPGLADLVGARFQVAVWIAVSFFGVARFFTYIDQRIRLEGWELKLRLRSVGQAMEEAARW
jgi:hypothetical protein